MQNKEKQTIILRNEIKVKRTVALIFWNKIFEEIRTGSFAEKWKCYKSNLISSNLISSSIKFHYLYITCNLLKGIYNRNNQYITFLFEKWIEFYDFRITLILLSTYIEWNVRIDISVHNMLKKELSSNMRKFTQIDYLYFFLCINISQKRTKNIGRTSVEVSSITTRIETLLEDSFNIVCIHRLYVVILLTTKLRRFSDICCHTSYLLVTTS